MQILGFLFLIVVFALVLILLFVLRIVSTGMSMFHKLGRGRTTGRRSSRRQTVHDRRSADKAHRKIFDRHDGEYVDFEEVD